MEIVSSITKYAVMVNDPKDLVYETEKTRHYIPPETDKSISAVDIAEITNALNGSTRPPVLTGNADGFSKAYAMTGWRLGYAAAPAKLTKKMGVLLKQSSCVPPFIQKAGIEALRNVGSYVETMRST